MVYRKKLPDTASIANSQDNGRLFAPSAARNSAAIVELVERVAPKSDKHQMVR